MVKHIVLFSFRKNLSPEKIIEADSLFRRLPQLISEIQDFESGINISPENLNKGYTHAYLLSFPTENARDKYLIHKDHVSFTEVIKDLIEDVLVFDYKVKV